MRGGGWVLGVPSLEAGGGDLAGFGGGGLRCPFLLLKRTAVRRFTPAGDGVWIALRSGGWSEFDPCLLAVPVLSSVKKNVL